MRDSIFFIAIIPNKELAEEVTEFKQFASEHFESSHALKSPPHITLIPPFRWKMKEAGKLQKSLKKYVKGQKAFYLSLNKFDCFRPNVIFVKIGESIELRKLQKQLGQHLERDLALKNTDTRPYHPHMTVAFKDLKQSVFKNAWDHYSSLRYERVFRVNEIYLLKHTGRRWEIFDTCYF
ncbi:MAG: 2'-5' RNA ligase family protein [Bacteroidetes bacterium]|nr:2'-5' RNA ligase family protein [Bacteroidota bacterium]